METGDLKRQAPAARALLAETAALQHQLRQLPEGADRERMAKRLALMCLGRNPESLAFLVRRFCKAVENGRFGEARGLWTRLGPFLNRTIVKLEGG